MACCCWRACCPRRCWKAGRHPGAIWANSFPGGAISPTPRDLYSSSFLSSNFVFRPVRAASPIAQAEREEAMPDLERIALQEQRLQFERFDATTAWALGARLKSAAEAHGFAV